MSVMAVCEVKNAATWLRRYMKGIEEQDLTLRVVCVYGESSDATLSLLKHWSRISKHSIEIYAEPYLPPEERNGWSLARIKRESQSIFLKGSEDYYFTCDCDNVVMQPDLVSRLVADFVKSEKRGDVGVVAPYVWTEGRRRRTFYDTYVFRVDGCRFHPYNPPGLDGEEPMEVDSVGNCFLASRKALEVGMFTNPFPQLHFCNDIRDKGFSVWVDPRLNNVHVDLERLNIMHYPPPIPLTESQFIDDKGEKYSLQFIRMIQLREMHDEYDAWLRNRQPEYFKWVEGFDASRPLITASYKVFNEAEYLPYSLRSVYPYVDRIDIVEGAVAKNMHCANQDGGSIDDTIGIIEGFPDPAGKIRLVQGKWKTKQHIQQKLLELCESRWMLFIDGDELYLPHDLKQMRAFCSEHLDGEVVYAVPERTLNFWHDWRHIIYSLNKLSPWGMHSSMHPSLVYRDVPGLTFSFWHTYPLDGFGRNIALNDAYQNRRIILNNVYLYHYGHAKDPKSIYMKLQYYKQRGTSEVEGKVEDDMYFSGVLPVDMVIKPFKGQPPPPLRGHPRDGESLIKVTATKPIYKFERLK